VKSNWLPLTPRDIPAFVECLEKYPLSMSDEIREFPLQYYTLRVNSPDTLYVRIPLLCYLALDPIGPYDAVFHPVRDRLYRQKKKIYLDTVKSFMLWAIEAYSLNRLTLCVNEGADQAHKIAKLLGFEYEGTCKQARKINEKFIDVHIFGLLKREIKWDLPEL